MTSGAVTVASLGYGRDPTGQVISEARTGLPGPAGTTSFGYDPADRLTTRDGQATWAYDDADNLTGRSGGVGQRFDVANQLCWTDAAAAPTSSCGAGVPATATVYGYDGVGNRASRTPAAGPVSSFGYDQANRLVKADRGPGEAGVAAGWYHSVAAKTDGTVWGGGRTLMVRWGTAPLSTRPFLSGCRG